jgi:hypothetical protein
MAISSAIIAITTRSSIRVKPFDLAMMGLLIFERKCFSFNFSPESDADFFQLCFAYYNTTGLADAIHKCLIWKFHPLTIAISEIEISEAPHK